MVFELDGVAQKVFVVIIFDAIKRTQIQLSIIRFKELK
jgi:hypothetical protein